jgi:hypothetical protein
MRDILKSTRAFEAWMRKRTDVSRRLLKKKHRRSIVFISLVSGPGAA